VTNPDDLQTPKYPVRLVAVRTGLSPHVLRAWERRYRAVTPTRTDGGQRLYSDLDVQRLLHLQRLTDRGHAIGRIAALPLDELARLDEEAAERLPVPGLTRSDDGGSDLPGQAVTNALAATRRLDAVELMAVLERAAVSLGVPVFIDQVVAPALAHIGHGWSERSVSVAQEHMATAVFRRVLGWLLRVYEARSDAPRIVVATPPGHGHELGALMAAASAAAEGWGVTYLGPDLPVMDLVGAAAQAGARVVAISAVYQPSGADLLGALRETRASLPEGIPLLAGGPAALAIGAEARAAGVYVVESLADFRTLLPRLAETPAA
jgi:DNA-binding transcriptional MerR regulator/methylmalonyl-CoA mutase cobalamin-binding subunit